MSGRTNLVVTTVLSLIGATLLTALILRAPMNMPEALDQAIRWTLARWGRDDLADPDDMADIALIVYFVAALVVSALVVTLAGAALRRRAA